MMSAFAGVLKKSWLEATTFSDIEIGAGAPKIIVPIVGVTKNDIIEEAKTFHSIPVDVVEWRVDWFEGVFDFAQVEDVLKDLREAHSRNP